MKDFPILIVDDEPVIRRTLSFILEKEGFPVTTAANGREGVELARASKPGLIILDVMMPEMDGLSACRSIKSDPSLSEVPVYLLTAKGRRADREAGMAAGADGYFIKPFHPATVIDAVVEAFERSLPESV